MCVCSTHDAIVVAVPEQHGAVVAGGAVEVEDQGVSAVLLTTDVGDVVPHHPLLRGGIRPLSLLHCAHGTWTGRC